MRVVVQRVAAARVVEVELVNDGPVTLVIET
jgi:D-Tyr-tRNAtyr deacylase